MDEEQEYQSLKDNVMPGQDPCSKRKNPWREAQLFNGKTYWWREHDSNENGVELTFMKPRPKADSCLLDSLQTAVADCNRLQKEMDSTLNTLIYLSCCQEINDVMGE